MQAALKARARLRERRKQHRSNSEQQTHSIQKIGLVEDIQLCKMLWHLLGALKDDLMPHQVDQNVVSPLMIYDVLVSFSPKLFAIKMLFCFATQIISDPPPLDVRDHIRSF
jgi:hypothetical protein